MEINIKGNPGTGNRFEETRIGHTDNFFNQVEKVENHQTTVIEINLSLHIHLGGEDVAHLFTKLTQQLFIDSRHHTGHILDFTTHHRYEKQP